MRLKKIETGMVIHVKNGEEYKELLKEAKRLGYVWISGSEIVVDREYFAPSKQYIVFHGNNEIHDFRYIAQRFRCENAIEFSDLVLPDITAEEAIEWLSTHYSDGEFKNAFGHEYSMGDILNHMTSGEVVEKIEQYITGHEKKEPEIETVYICRISKFSQMERSGVCMRKI